MIITKYCSRLGYEKMLQGCFRLGSHLHFRSQVEAGGALSDHAEGMGEMSHKGDVLNASFSIGSGRFRNVTFSGNGRNIVIGHEVNFHVFCASSGAYSQSQHRNLRDGKNDYGGNPDYECWISLDLSRVLQAFDRLMACKYPNPRVSIHGAVQYGDRETFVDHPNQFNFLANDPRTQMRLALTKPLRFEPEDEY